MEVFLGIKGRELWYPKYAPHIDFRTGKSSLAEVYHKYPERRLYVCPYCIHGSCKIDEPICLECKSKEIKTSKDK